MPELAEIRLMSDYINDFKGDFIKTFKSTVTKIQTVDLDEPGYFLGAVTRGKELMLNFEMKKVKTSLIFNMGMTGNWRKFNNLDAIQKHSHFNILMADRTVLSMVDSRRFARWKYQDHFSDNRGPDMTEDIFKTFLNSKIGIKQFEKPVYELMMDQAYFSGCGNYLRAEILYRLDIDPFQSLNTVLEKNIDNFVNMCKLVPLEAYKIGGAEFQNFKNPNTSEKMNMGAWMLCYNKKGMFKILDSKKRNFWFDPKWRKNIL